MFEGWFHLVPKMTPTILVISLVGLLPGSILIGLGIVPYIQALINIAGEATRIDPENTAEMLEVFSTVLGSFGLLFLGAIVLSLGSYYAEITVQWLTMKSGKGETATMPETLVAVFPGRFFRGILAAILKGLIFAGVFLVLALGIGLLSIVVGLFFGGFGRGMGAGIAVAAVFILLYIFVIAVFVAFDNYLYLVQPAIVDESSGGEAISRSFKLVMGQFWRLLGIRIVTYLAIAVASGIVTMIPSFILILPGLMEIAPMFSNPEMLFESPQIIFRFVSSLGPSMIILTYLSLLLSLATYPVFQVFMYMDQRVRKGDVPEAVE